MFGALQRRMLWLTCGLGALALLTLSGVLRAQPRAQPNGSRLHAPPAFGPRQNSNPGRGGSSMVQVFPQVGTQIYGQFLTGLAIQGQVQTASGFGSFNGFNGFGNQFNGFNGFNGQFGGQFGFNGFGNQFGFGNFQGVNGFGNANGFGNQFSGNFGGVQGFGNVNGANGFGNGGFNGFNNGFGNFGFVGLGFGTGIGVNALGFAGQFQGAPGGQGLQNGGKGFGFSGGSG